MQGYRFTGSVTWTWIMMRAEFRLGVLDKRAGKDFRPDYELWDSNRQRYYELGRMWATVAPAAMSLRIGRRINMAAVFVLDAIPDAGD